MEKWICQACFNEIPETHLVCQDKECTEKYLKDREFIDNCRTCDKDIFAENNNQMHCKISDTNYCNEECWDNAPQP